MYVSKNKKKKNNKVPNFVGKWPSFRATWPSLVRILNNTSSRSAL